ncbi:class I SAM-dependent methyltransferase [Caballeronia udeis]|nr:class I SAM-dependent methyltransferase [Caballeronia udeis]
MLFIPHIRKFARHVPVLKVVYTGCYRTHPIDTALGTDTGGIEPPESIFGDDNDAGNLPYMGSQPSTIRFALQQLGDLHDHTFIDIGCGKGRPMIVATEFSFLEVTGFDLAPRLVDIANHNAQIVGRRYPERVPMRAFATDALAVDFPSGKLVVYLFNPFGNQTMTRLLAKLVTAHERGTIEAFAVIYLNPVCAEVFDSSPLLERRYCGTVPYADDEIGYDEGTCQQVSIWSSTPRTRQDSALCQNSESPATKPPYQTADFSQTTLDTSAQSPRP